MKHLIWIFIIIVVACTPTTSSEPSYTAPIPLSLAESEFIDSDIVASWEWSELEQNQVFALRVGYEDDPPQDLWLADKQVNIQSMIDSYSQAVGTFYWQVAVVNTSTEGGFDSMGSEWSEVVTLNRVRRFTLEPLPSEIQSDMARYISEQGFTSQFEIANFTRDFVYTNTDISRQGDYAADFSDAMQSVFNHWANATDAPQLYCNGMSTGMLTVFQEVGIESRLVFLYGAVSGWFTQHTFLEVFNSDTQRWEVQDPTFNLYYVDTETGERVSAERMVFGDLDTLVGCNTDGTCSREVISETVEEYLGAFRSGHAADEVWINPNRLNISQRITGQENNNFPEFISRMTGIAQRDIIFHFDSWESIDTPDI
ncbi:MAG: hypothetical protein Q9P01_18925 [Anaerolineae bacterium]|nr:hypothetical protein [Anaerolineae bacterium]